MNKFNLGVVVFIALYCWLCVNSILHKNESRGTRVYKTIQHHEKIGPKNPPREERHNPMGHKPEWIN